MSELFCIDDYILWYLNREELACTSHLSGEIHSENLDLRTVVRTPIASRTDRTDVEKESIRFGCPMPGSLGAFTRLSGFLAGSMTVCMHI